MKNLIIIFLFLFFSSYANASEKLSIVYASTLPDIAQNKYPSYSQLSSLLKQVKAKSKNVIFLFGGDSLGPSALSSLDKGAHIIDILNSLEPDAMSVDKREFSFFEDELSLRSFEAAFPLVASNLTDSLTQNNIDGLNNSILIKKGNIKIGIISVINPNVIEEYALKRIIVKDIEDSIITESKKLKAQGANLIILLQGNYFEISDKLIKEKVIDLAFTKNIHFNLIQNTKPQNKKNILITTKDEVSLINIKIDNNSIIDYKNQFVSLNEFPKDKRILRQIIDYTDRLNLLLDEKIGVFETSFNTKREVVRAKESKFANLLTDAIKEYVDADIALINGGTIRGEKHYPKNYQISRRDIAKELPFRNKVVLIEVKGEQILNALENGLSLVQILKGRFPHVSGMKVTYDINRPVNSRVIKVLVNNQPLIKTKKYRLATTNYLAQGGDGYSMFVDQKRVSFLSPKYRTISDVLTDYILKKHKVLPKIEERLVDLDNE